MTGGKSPLGYTIVEVMIVLAVSGMMFVIAASFISGKQEHISFMTGVSEMASRLQDTIEQVSDGQYTDVQFTCNNVAGNNTLQINSTPRASNPDCIFLGKLLYFPAESSTSATSYQVFSLAGARLEDDGITPVTSLAMAKPTPVTSPDLTDDNTTPQSLDIKDVMVDGAQGYSFGFAQSLGSVTSNQFNSGTQSVQLIKASLIPGDSEAGVTTLLAGSGVATANNAVICLTDGTRYATLTVGSNNNQLSVDTQQGLSSC